jgi:hypothetical protein
MEAAPRIGWLNLFFGDCVDHYRLSKYSSLICRNEVLVASELMVAAKTVVVVLATIVSRHFQAWLDPIFNGQSVEDRDDIGKQVCSAKNRRRTLIADSNSANPLLTMGGLTSIVQGA